MSHVEVEVRWDSVLVDNGDVVTKTVFPASADLKIRMAPSLVAIIDNERVEEVTLVEAAEEYRKLLKSKGTYEDFEMFCGREYSIYLERLKLRYTSVFGTKLPALLRRPRTPPKVFTNIDYDNAMLALSDL